MILFVLIPIGLLILSAWASTAISFAVHKSLVKAGNSNAKLFQVLVWFGSFILLAGVTFLLLVNNITLER
jgi:hypothetical protein